jgi:glutamate synthase domain-containing protein 3
VVEGVGDHACEYMTNGTVVVLGETGKNFAAGMSGGLAYVFDPMGEFARVRCNPAGVDLEPLFESEDIATLERLLLRHVEYTGSRRAQQILEGWPQTLKHFVKVFPHEYRRVLASKEKTEEVKLPVGIEQTTATAAAVGEAR